MSFLHRLKNNDRKKIFQVCKQPGEEHLVVTQSPTIDLSRLGNGESGIVVELQGGGKFSSTLKAMGILPGVVIVKKSASPLNGPIVIEKGCVQLAIGRGVARKVIVKPVAH
jgi:ferrous iron transport protein A